MKVCLKKSPLFYLFLFGFFCLDIYGYFILGHNIFSATLILFTIVLAQPINVIRLASILFFLSLESFFFYGRAYFYLIYLIPILIMIVKLRDRFWDSFSCMVVTLLAALLGQIFILEFYLLDGPFFSIYYLLSLIVNILLLTIVATIA